MALRKAIISTRDHRYLYKYLAPPRPANVAFTDDWDDMRFPAQGINPAGTAAPPTVITSLTDYTGCLSFSGTLENIIAITCQMTHEWKAGSMIYPHIHWHKVVGSANAVDWRLAYRILGNPGDTPQAWVTNVAVEGIVGDATVTEQRLLSYWPAIDLTGYKESCEILFRVHRLGNTDADNNAAVLSEFDVHYQKDKPGTEDQIPA